MKSSEAIKIFEDKKVRTLWDEESEVYLYCRCCRDFD